MKRTDKNMENFYSMDHEEIFTIIKDCFDDADDIAEGIKTAISKNARNMKAKSESRNFSRAASTLARIAEDLHIINDDDEIEMTADFENMTHDEILDVFYEHMADLEDAEEDINMQIATDSRSTALKNRRKEINCAIDALCNILEALDIDLADFRDAMESKS